MAKILITGGAGFVGYHLARHLSKNDSNTLHIVDNLSRGKQDPAFEELLRNNNIKFIKADLTNPKFYELLDDDYDYIYALAAVIGVKNIISNPDKALYANTLTILNLLEWIKNTNKSLKKLFFPSSSEVYAGTFKHYNAPIPTDEKVNLTVEDISLPRTTYALSKMVGESACFNYCKKYKIPFIIGRYHNVYGPRMGNNHVIPELLLKAKVAREYLDVHSVNHTRAFCYLDDAAEMTIGLTQLSNLSGEIFNIGNSEEEITIGKLAQKIINTVNPSLKIKALDNQDGSPERRCPNIDKLKKAIHFKPKISLNNGIALTWEWYKDLQEN